MLIGIVGKPSVGKSTFFKACTLADVAIANYPFTTIKPNHAVGFVKIHDVAKEFGKTANPREGFCTGGYRFVSVDLMDVAGLVPGAHEGLGMGNQFLDDLRQADVLVHVVDASGSVNEKGESVEPLSYDPLNDVKFLEEELDYWYLSLITKGWDKFAKSVQFEHGQVYAAIAKQLSALKVDEDMVKDVLLKTKLGEKALTAWATADQMLLAQELRKITKPMIIAANKMDVPGAEKNIDRLRASFPDHRIIGCSAETELALREAAKHELITYVPGDTTFTLTKKGEEKLNEPQKKALTFIQETLKKYQSTGVQQVLDAAVFDILKYIAIHPGGVSKLEDSEGRVLPDCFLMKGGTTALDFAYRLHTDFGKNFIRAIDVKTKRTVGKEHLLKHTDIVEIVAGR